MTIPSGSGRQQPARNSGVSRGIADWVWSVAFSPDGRYVLSGSSDKTLRLWEVATGKELRRFEGHSGRVCSVAFSPDGRYVLSGSRDKTIRLWEVATGKELRRFEGHSSWVISVAFSPDGRYILSGSEDRTLRLWEVATGKELRRFEGHSDYVMRPSPFPLTADTSSRGAVTRPSGSGNSTGNGSSPYEAGKCISFR